MRKDWVDLVGKADANATAIASTTTETEIFRIPVARDELADGKKFRMRAWFKYGTTGTPTLTFKARAVARAAGATTGVVLAQSALMTTPSGVSDAMGMLDLEFTVRSNGTAGTLMCTGEAKLYAAVAPTVGSATGAPAISAMGSAGITVPVVATVDFTVDKDLLLTATWSASSLSNTLTGLELSVERMN